MNKIRTILLASFICLSACAERIHIEGTTASFEAPAGFQPLSKEIIEFKWPNNRGPKFAIGNESASTTVAYDLKPHTIPQDQLHAVQASFTATFNRIIPGIQWNKNEIIELEGQKWLYMEMTSNAIDTDIYNMMLLTGIDQKMLIFNFNSTKEEFKKYEATLRQSIQSIKLR